MQHSAQLRSQGLLVCGGKYRREDGKNKKKGKCGGGGETLQSHCTLLLLLLQIQRDVQETQETMSELKEEFARRKTGDACKITENSQLKEALRTPCTVPKQAKIGMYPVLLCVCVYIICALVPKALFFLLAKRTPGNDAAAHRSEGKERPKTTFQERKQKLGQLYSELERIGHCV